MSYLKESSGHSIKKMMAKVSLVFRGWFVSKLHVVGLNSVIDIIQNI